MNSVLYYIVFLVLNAFDTYIIYQFMKSFFKDNYNDKTFTLILYIIYYSISSLIYIFLSNFVLNLTSSVLLVFMLTMGYRSKISTKLISTILAVLTFLTAEIIIAVLIGAINIDLTKHTYYGTELTLLAVSILKYLFVKIISRFRNLNGDIKPPKSFLLIAVFVPLISVFLEMQLITQNNISEIIYASTLVCVVLLNFMVFYLYDSITKLFTEKVNAAAAKQKSIYYQKEAQLLEQNMGEIKKLRHDMKNHLIAISELSKKHGNTDVTDYISALSEKMVRAEEYSQTGILSLDSIINYKLTQAKQSGIKVSCEIAVPNDLKIASDDFVTIIGNLLDNAIEAAEKIQDDKYIFLNIRYTKGTLLITVKNSFDGILNIKNKQFQTTKKDTSLHGIGLQSIENAIRNYNGEMITSYNDLEFITKIILIV
ncbi:MAG: GHKL domain-containing protein [Clostridia bacterium]|nr:GHKL domain-containing protein [Clostridia bacterium]